MSVSTPLKLFALGILTLVLVSIGSAFAASLSVPESNLERQSLSVRAEDIKPAACSAIYLSNIVRGAGTLTGTAGNDLIIGSAGADVIDGAAGDDCILGGGGDDLLTGSDGSDICIGGFGTDTFAACEQESE